MAICGCPNGLVVTALLALLALPARYLAPEPAPAAAAPGPLAALNLALAEFPPLDLFATGVLIVLAAVTFFAEWIQRKIMEKRIVKLNQYLVVSVERLRAWDEQQEQLEGTLRLVQNATSEYNLLLYLLLRQHRCVAANCPPSSCFFDKGRDEPLSFLGPNVDI